MNTKKNKNKSKQNKQPDPSPSLTTETSSAEAEEKAIEKPEAVVKSDERVPEIISDIVKPTAPEKKESEGDTPKKPKRNRGKKKKTDKEDTEDKQEEKTSKVMPEKKIVDEGIKVDPPIQSAKEQTSDTTNTAPNAKKKKGKKGEAEDQSAGQTTLENPSEKPIKITRLTKSEAENIMSDVKIITCVPIATEGSEKDGKKKKHKNKKRTDSEKSEKEEILACTSAFQKILEPREDIESKKIKDKSSDTIKPEPLEMESAHKETTEKVSLEMILKDKIDTKPEQKEDSGADTHKDISKDESIKSKKKNKKDKKHLPKEGSEDELSKTPEPKECVKETVSIPTPHEVEDKSSIEDWAASEENVLADTAKIEVKKSPILKAKIIKPVEKKNKDVKSDEPPKTFESPEPVHTLKPVEIADMAICLGDMLAAAKEKSEQKSDEKIAEITDLTAQVIIEEKEESSQITPDFENITVPESFMIKKRKKSPKPKRIEEIKTDHTKMPDKPHADVIVGSSILPIVETKEPKNIYETGKECIKEELKRTTESIKAVHEDAEDKELLKSKAIPLPMIVSDTKPTEMFKVDTMEQNPIADKVACKDKLIESELETEAEMIQRIPTPDGGMGKKRKKSPKLPRKNESIPEFNKSLKDLSEPLSKMKIDEKPQPIPADLTMFKTDKKNHGCDKKHEGIQNIEESKNTDEDITKSVDFLKLKASNLAKTTETELIGEIEVSSLKTEESEGSICDLIPEVDYPRSSSQSADDNNNMSIREITSIGSNQPSAFVMQKSDSTIVESSDTLSLVETPPISKKEEKMQIKAREEKTDLKSKMMEVNQDMEGLRKSIEKSLAELSVIEKSEKSTEEQFVEAQTSKLEQIKLMALKQKSNIKQNIALSGEKQDQANIRVTTESPQPLEIKEHNIISKPDCTESQIPQLTTVKTGAMVLVPSQNPVEIVQSSETPKTPEPPARKDNKGKGRSKKKGKQETEQLQTHTLLTGSSESSATVESKDSKSEETKKEDKSEQKSEKSSAKGKQQAATFDEDHNVSPVEKSSLEASKTDVEQFEPIENFEDALTSSADDVNKTFELIANDPNGAQNNPEINITAPIEDTESDKQSKTNPVSQPKNLLGHPAIPARSNKMDYKKEKNKSPNTQLAKVKIKDAVLIDKNKESKDTQTENNKRFIKDRTGTKPASSMINENEEYVYKYSFRRVFLPNACHVCKMDLKIVRVPCNICNLVFYCSPKHKDEDYEQHQALCFAVSTIISLKDQKHLYANTANVIGHDFRLLRMQMIVSCEKVLQRRLVPCEQEMLLYPRLCAEPTCREWRQEKLKDCEGCGQVAFCSDNAHHFPTSHQRWCKSYALYYKLVKHQQTKGRLDPMLPSKVMAGHYKLPDRMNEVLASMYEQKIDMSDIQYAALTQVATAPLTTGYCYQLYSNQMNASFANGVLKKYNFTIHVVGAELQFEADVLNKWEVFFLHLRPEVTELRIVLVGPDLNPGNLPLDLLGKIKLCENCRSSKRRVIFDFQDKRNYSEYWSTDFTTPDLVCTFNPSIHRSSVLNGKDSWPSTIKCILKQKVPFVVTSYTINELQRDLARIRECSADFNIISEPKFNTFASVRPDRNFISDDEMPLLFKNYCYMVLCGAF